MEVSAEQGINVAMAPMGLRERSKIKRRLAIKEAAREVFLERGYDEATTRDIAERAEVSPGTLFAYAPAKSELLLMIVNDDLDEITHREFEGAAGKSLMQVLLDFCASRYTYWHKLGALAGPARKEVHGIMIGRNDLGPEGERFKERNPRILQGLSAEVARRQAKGTLTAVADPELAGRIFWAIYYAEIDLWLRLPKPSVREGLALLQQLFALVLQGLGASDEELAIGRAAPPARKSVASTRTGTRRRTG